MYEILLHKLQALTILDLFSIAELCQILAVNRLYTVVYEAFLHRI